MPEQHRQAEGAGPDWLAFLKPLYGAEGPIILAVGSDEDTYRRGDVECLPAKTGHSHVLEVVSALVRWDAWLRKARLGTLRWIAAQEGGRLSAGTITATASVRSQLEHAELVGRSPMWGDEVSEDCYNLRLWALCELERRDH